MIKLYKRDADGVITHYHELWAEPRNRRLVEHWGALGERGETRVHRAEILTPLARQFDRILSAPREAGFAEVARSEETVLLVEYGVDGAGTEDDLDKRRRLEELLNECLGWHGLGYCDGGGMGSGTMEAACFVVNEALARAEIAETLADTEFSDYSRIYRED